ncbi:MAG: thioredoxin domain-containing protein [Acidobacteria bacterium]|nr:thioredoxin domain-containing protein [Acidobacteriota bacterium]
MTTKLWLLPPVFLLLVAGSWANESNEDTPKKPVATVAGQAIYEEALLPLIQSQMLQLRQQEYQVKSDALENLINQMLLEAAAQEKKMTAAEFFQQEVDAKIADPTDGEVEALYEAQKDRINKPLAEVKEPIRQALKQSKLQQAREEFFQKLRQDKEVAVFLQPPKIEVSYDPARVLGNPNAPITIVEFSDFQCPFCEQAYPVVQALLSKYDGKVKLAYRDFPLRQIHAQAQPAAEASRCAGEQGQFWQYHDLLFEHFGKLDHATLAEHAQALGLDSEQFEGCLANGKYRAEIEQDIQEGAQAGITGTPGFFINGILVSGAQPAAAFEKVIEAELARLQK